MLNSADTDVIQLHQAHEMFAVARLDGTMLQCSPDGAKRCFGMTSEEVLQRNILSLVDSFFDQVEFQKLVQPHDAHTTLDADETCLLRTKGKKLFVFADRRPLYGSPMSDTSSLGVVLPMSLSYSNPDLRQAHSPDARQITERKNYNAVDTTDMSFNDVFEDMDDPPAISRSPSATSTVLTPAMSEQSLVSEAIAKPVSPRADDAPDDESNWGWFMTVSPSSSTNLSNMTRQMRIN